VLRFSCSKCSAKLTAREDRAGTVTVCPRCKNRITIPAIAAQPPRQTEPPRDVVLVEPATTPGQLAVEPPGVDEPNVDPREQDDKLLISLGVTPLPQHTGERRRPWPIDVLLYPMTQTGLSCIAVLAAAPLIVWFIRAILGGIPMMGILFFLGKIALGMYAGWYWAECVYDSARGGTRAPDASALKIGKSDIGSRITYIASVYAVYVVPVFVYYLLFRRIDAACCALAAWTVIFFPMALLAMVMHDSTCALNPFFLLGSIFRTFFQYAGLLLLFLGVAAAGIWIRRAFPFSLRHPPVWRVVVRMAVLTYVVFLMTHILGRFYWRNRERLNWGI
jgi:DNA-directed RNA polymerase subunit RPC12/RpoP